MTERVHVLFENNRMLAVDKPAGTLVIPDQYTPREHTLTGRVEQYLGSKPFIVHRIDRDTTGIVLFAKDAEAHTLLCTQFEQGTVSKQYLALVNGTVPQDAGVIDAPLLIEGRSVTIDPAGKPSVTRYTVAERFRDFTLVRAEPETGRRHQIRIHLLSLGHPLAVDAEYGNRTELRLSEFKKKYKPSGTEKPLISRLTLHAAAITVTPPEAQEPVTITAELPDDFAITLKQLRKHNHR